MAPLWTLIIKHSLISPPTYHQTQSDFEVFPDVPNPIFARFFKAIFLYKIPIKTENGVEIRILRIQIVWKWCRNVVTEAGSGFG